MGRNSCLLLIVILSAFVTIQDGDGVASAIPADDQGCQSLGCDTYGRVNTLWCHNSANRFCQCRPSPSTGIWTLQLMPCAPDTPEFSFRHQVCIHAPRNATECDPENRDIPEPDPILCEGIPCGTYEEINRLGCHPDPKTFCQCRPLKSNPSVFAPLAMPCAPGTSFSFRLQTCARDELWVDSC